jgi:hypothetical protein
MNCYPIGGIRYPHTFDVMASIREVKETYTDLDQRMLRQFYQNLDGAMQSPFD